ncbi:ABC transporter permease [Microbacterium halophytorum]|uniref:ABC transporter permease n=1 Tax=Microbacterium halophytorum TaxID=2067568 RepID=UPI000CFA9610|nr:ABC transporter permease [Microbacterium halophytorum]
MLKFLLRRVVSGAVLLIALAVLAYFLLRLGTADIAQQIAGQSAGPEQVALIEERFGLDLPLLQQFGIWAASLFTEDMGRSWFTGQPVGATVFGRTGVTVTLAIGSVLLTGVFGVILGVVAATRRGALDRVVQILAVIGQAIPGFLIAVGLVLLFAVQLDWFPATGYTPIGDSVAGWLQSITLPIVALALGSVGGVAQQVRGSVLDVLGRDHVRTLRSRGLPESRVIYRYVLRNAGGPALSVLGLQFVIILSASVVVEQVFSIPGLGPIALTSTMQGDVPLVMGIVLVMGAMVIVVNLIVDLLQGIINPKVRLS